MKGKLYVVRLHPVRISVTVALVLIGLTALANIANQTYVDPAGRVETVSSSGYIDTSNPFFVLDSKGRTCVMCHEPGDAWSLSAQNVRRRFQTAETSDPLFRSVDAKICPTDDISTSAGRRNAYRLLLSKGLVRRALNISPDAEFEVIGLADPYGCATTTELSVYRRPPIVANLRFDTSTPPPNVSSLFPPAIAKLMLSLSTAQMSTTQVGRLDDDGAHGGPMYLSKQQFVYGANDPLASTNFNPDVFTLFASWSSSARAERNENREHENSELRQSIARGEAIFNRRPIRISGVAGLNDTTGVPVITGFCETCHNNPNVGNHSVYLPMNTGVESGSRRTRDLPLYTLRNKRTGETVQTTDPALAASTGKWADIGKFTVPTLRGLAAHAPYFRNGSAESLMDVVNFYDERFELGLSEQEKRDLVAFLNSL